MPLVLSENPDNVQVRLRVWEGCNSPGPEFFRVTWERTSVEKRDKVMLEQDEDMKVHSLGSLGTHKQEQSAAGMRK